MINKNIKLINYKLWLVLILTSFIPLIYSTIRIHFLGSIPNSWTFSIAAQIVWLSVGYEVLNESLLIPLVFVLGKVIVDKKHFAYQASVAFSIIVFSYLIFTIIILLFTPQLIQSMKQQAELFVLTSRYIRLEAVAILISSFYAFLSLVLVLQNKQKALYGLLILQTVATIICDSMLVSLFPFSLNLGVIGIAISNIIVQSLLAGIALYYFKHSNINLSFNLHYFYKQGWLIEWARIGWKSGLESLIRNAAYIVMILQLINQVQHSETFWLANQFIWGWLLLPILTLGQLIKQDAATNGGLSSQRVNNYLWITIGVISIWIMTALGWEPFIQKVMGINDSHSIIKLVWLMVGFFVVFALNNVIDSYFYGIGRTDLILYQSLIVNTLFYGSAFVLYQIGVFIPSLDRIAIMFGFGIILDSIITWILYQVIRQQSNICFG